MLGPLEVWDDHGQPVRIGGARLRALLAMLALDAGQVTSPERLTQGLWGAAPPAGAANALQSLVSRLRSALGGTLVESGPGGYRLADPASVDARRFTDLATAGRRALGGGRPEEAAPVLEQALALWRGPALADVRDAPFAPAAAARLDQLHLGAVEDHAEACLALGRHADLVTELESLVAAHPLRERLRGLLMRALYATGRQADALGAYEQARRVLADELGVDPSPDLEAVHLAVLRHDVPTAPAPGQEQRGNVRSALTSFVGRDEDVERIGKLLEEVRLVTLTGPGGAGKTRLANESAARQESRIPDGVWIVELARVSDPMDVPHAVLTTLAIREAVLTTTATRGAPPQPATDPTERLTGALAHRRTLLVLDNCEHLLDAVARVVDRVLTTCPGVRVLATSREPLAVAGETLHPVAPLALPPDGIGPELAAQYPAMRLLIDRAGAASPAFAVDSGNVAALVQICRRLDGMPLAIELAAARLRALSADQVAERLDDRFRLLTGGARTALPRHQTLRAVVDWSWDLLDDPERVLLRRLSVFAAGATLQSVEQVCSGAGLAGEQMLDLLPALVDKSLVEADADCATYDRVTRYRMLETIRAYGAEKLAESGESERVRRAHARFFLDLVETAEPKLRGPDQLMWLQRLDVEHDNILAALRWTIGARESYLSLRFIAALGWYWWLHGYRAEGGDWARQVLDLVGEEPPDGMEQAYVLAMFMASRGFTEWAVRRPKMSEALGRANARGERMHPLSVLLEVFVTMFDGDEERLAGLLAPHVDGPDPWLRSWTLAIRGGFALNAGRPDDARRDMTAALHDFRAVRERWGTVQILTALAELAGYEGDLARAENLLAEAASLAEEINATDELPEVLLRRAGLRARFGDVRRAEEDLDHARAVIAQVGGILGEHHTYLTEGLLHLRHGRIDEARETFMQAAELFGDDVFAPPQIRAYALLFGGRIMALQGTVDEAERVILQALDSKIVRVDAPVTAAVLDSLAVLAHAQGDLDRAATLLGAAVRLRGLPDGSDPDVIELAAALRTELGEAGYDDAYQRGAAMDRDTALAYIGASPTTRD